MGIQVPRPASAPHKARPSKDGATTVRIVLPYVSLSTIPEDSVRVYLTGFALALKIVTMVVEAAEEIKPHPHLAVEKVMSCHCQSIHHPHLPTITIPTPPLKEEEKEPIVKLTRASESDEMHEDPHGSLIVCDGVSLLCMPTPHLI